MINWEFIVSEIESKRCPEIGSGEFGSVFKVNIGGKDIAVKACDIYDSYVFGQCLQEGLRIFSGKSKYLTETYGVHIDKTRWILYIAIEFCEGGCLKNFIKENVKDYCSEKNIKILLYSLLKGVNSLNSEGIIHRDIKPENILLTQKGNVFNKEFIKICDFGLSGYIHKGKAEDANFSIISRWYRPLEIELEMPYNENIDVFSIACVLFEFITRRPLFPSYEDGLSHIKLLFEILGPISKDLVDYYEKIGFKEKGYHESSYYKKKKIFWGYVKNINHHTKKGNITNMIGNLNVSQELKKILLLCLNQDPRLRPTSKILLKNPYFDEIRDPIIVNNPVFIPFKNLNIKYFMDNEKNRIMRHIKKICIIFNYSVSTYILSFYILINFMTRNLCMEYKNISIAIVHIVSSYVADYEYMVLDLEKILENSYYKISLVDLNHNISRCLDFIISSGILPPTNFIVKMSKFVDDEKNILCRIIFDNPNFTIVECIDWYNIYGRYLISNFSSGKIISKICSFM